MRCFAIDRSQAGTACRRVLNLLLLGLSVSAQGMDLLQVYEAAEQQDATLLAAKAAVAGERERPVQANAQMLPNISASWSRNNNQLESIGPVLGQEQTSNSNYPSSNKTVSLRQPLYRKPLAVQYALALAQVDDAEATLALAQQNLAVRVSSAYFEAMLSHDQLALVLTQKESYRTQLDAARKALVAGTGTRTDIDETQAKLDMNTALEIEAQQNVSYTLQQVQSLTSQPVDQIARLDIARLTLENPQPNQLAHWIKRAEQHSPQIQSLNARVEVARQELTKANSGHYPSLDAVAQWSQSASENVTNTGSRYTNRSVGLQLNIPIFAGGYVNSTVRQALAGLEHAEHLLEAGRRELGLQVHKEFRGVTENMPKIKALEQALRSAEQLVQSNHKSMQAGNRTLLDILNAQEQRGVVLRDLAQARYLYLLAKIRLLALVGGANREALAVVNQVLKN